MSEFERSLDEIDDALVLLTQVARQACRSLGGSGAAILACDDEARMLHGVAVHGTAMPLLGAVVPRDGGLVGEALDAGATALDGDPRGRFHRDELAPGLRVVAAAAVSVRRRVWGVLSVIGDEPVVEDYDDQLADLAAMVSTAVENVLHRKTLQETLDAGVTALAGLLDLRDGYTGSHADEVVGLCVAVAEELGLDGAALLDLVAAARLHDLGKVGIPDAILHKPGPLEPAEWALMRLHPVWGEQAARQIPGFGRIAAAIRSHHERWDGGGYPDELAGERIPLAARIIACCDTFHAMVSDRPYRAALPVEEAVARLRAAAGRQLDPHVVDAVLAAIEE